MGRKTLAEKAAEKAAKEAALAAGIVPQPKKPSSTPGYYFGQEEEDAFLAFIRAESQDERTKIFNSKLLAPFTKMVQSIIRRYKLYVPDKDFDEIFHDAMGFIITKADHFDPDSGYKAYSYCGTVVKNYLIGEIHRFSRNQQKNSSFSALEYSLSESEQYSYDLKLEKPLQNEMIDTMKREIQDMLDHAEKYKLKENEIKVGKGLIFIFNDWEEMFESMGSPKFNKSSFLFYMKEATRLGTPEIREGMRRYKSLYFNLKDILVAS